MEIRIEGLCKTYQSEGRTVAALDHVDLTIPANEIFTLLGPSGCGKTTLLRCIVGLETPDAGEIRIGDDIVWSAERRIAVPTEKRGLGMVFQTYAIWPHMSVFDNIAYPLQVRGTPRAQIREKVARALEFVQLRGVERQPATRLSGGQQQRVALARALVAEPRVILFDEPLSNLDAKLREETRKLLRQFLGELGITAIYVTHDRVEALALSHTIAVMQSGRVIETGTPQHMYFDAQHRYVADFIGRANQFPAIVRQRENDYTLARCGLGTIHCQARDLPEGAEATLCIRPEFIRITRHEVGPGFNVIEGTIESMDFVGEVYEAEIRVNDERLLARIDPDVKATPGERVEIRLDPAHCLLLSA
ncbi:ABC transporter ATP-binding protein [Castellaniella hirudinis]|uniref:ABC transporter ATP-binding protein n=1 Tax=Castellaniella hirudinis TaxID=1144617 RepID=A0ABV8S2A9_9BURK